MLQALIEGQHDPGLQTKCRRSLSGWLAGMILDEALADYPYLESEDLLVALEYGAPTSGGQQVVAPSS